MKVREIEESDYPIVASIYEKVFDYREGFIDRYYKGFEEYLDFCTDQGYGLLIGDDLKVCGVIIGYEKPDMYYGKSLYIEMFAVLSEEQKKGYGKILLDAMENKAKENGIKEISLRTKCYMEAYLIYNHLGFKDSQSDQRYMTKYIGEKEKDTNA